MKGHIEDISKDKHNIVIELGHDPATGRRKRLVRTVHGKKSWANSEMLRLMQELSTGTYVKPAEHDTAGFLRKWLEGRRPAGLSPHTIQGYAINIDRHIIPRIGHLRLDKVEPLHIQSLYSQMLAGGKSPKTVLEVHRTLHTALQQAVKWGMIRSNPSDATEKPRIKKRPPKTLQRAQIGAFFKAVRELPSGDVALLCFFTGLRRGEALALRWQDVDFEHSTLRVTQNLIRMKGQTIVKDAKTAGSHRAVLLPPSAVEILSGQYTTAISEYVFCRDNGQPLDPSTVTHQFGRIAASLGMKGELNLKGLRHTHATLLLEAGVHPKIVQERLGHASIRTTLDTYSHVTPTMQQQAVLAFEQIASTNGQLNGSNPSPKRLPAGKK